MTTTPPATPPPASPPPPPPAPPSRWQPSARPLVLLALAALVLALTALVLGRLAALRDGGSRTELTHAVAVERVRSVARLVTTEATVRDVVTFENSRFGSVKRTLLVVTGRVLAGVDLDPDDGTPGAEVRIDHEARRVVVVLPPARILGVEITDVRTYDERAGLLNPFRPADRDSIQREVRVRLEQAGHELRLVEQANESAALLLRSLLAQDGYTVTVEVRGPAVVRPAG